MQKISIITPAPRHSRKGNRVTAERWAGLLRELGHRVRVADAFDGRCFDAAFVLHARRCADDLRRARAYCPGAPLILCLTGTDVYRDIHENRAARESLYLADALLVLQDLAVNQLPRELRPRARVIHQSVRPPVNLPPRSRRHFDLCVIGHIRAEKDPLLAARAAALLPATSRVRVLLAGGIIEPGWAAKIRREEKSNPRFRHLGELTRGRALGRIAASRALVVSSIMEGGANVVGEACVVGTPVLASRIDGNVGLLGSDYEGLFEPGDAAGLARLIERLESEPSFERLLTRRCKALAKLFRPRRERAALKEILRLVH